MLLALVVVPLVVLWYRRLLRDRAERRARLAALGLVAPRATTAGWRRHVPPVLLLLALVVLVTGLARPEATVPQPRREGTVILAFDVSASMAAKDLAPDRIDAAKAAARTFVQKQPTTVRVGVVAFSGSGLVTQEPTTDKGAVLAAIDRLTPQGGTALAKRAADVALDDRRAAGADRQRARQPPGTARARTSATTARPRSSCSPTARTPPGPTRSTSPTSRPAPG